MQINWHGVGVYLATAPVDMRNYVKHSIMCSGCLNIPRLCYKYSKNLVSPRFIYST
jgi:hypothetical protein